MRISDWSSDVCSSDLLKPTDNFVTRSLPAGSEFLRPDNIIRALRAMDRHPVFDLGKAAVEQGVGIKPLHEVIGRYRSEERSVGKECVSTCRSRGPASH